MAEEKKNIVVFYHDRCIDGAASLWCFMNKYDDDPEVELTAYPLANGDPEERERVIFDNIYEDSEVYFVDVAPTDAELKKLLSPKEDGEEKEPWVKNIRIWDHHGSEVDRLNKFFRSRRNTGNKSFPRRPKVTRILDKSAPAAAGIVWGELFPGEELPEFLKFVEKMDRSTGLRNTEEKAIAASMGSKNISSVEEIRKTFNSFASMDMSEIEQEGHAIRSAQLNEMTKLADKFVYTKLRLLPSTDPLWVPIVNTDLQMHGRGIHETMVREGRKGPGPGVAMSWYVDGSGVVQLSVQTNGHPKAGEIAKYLGKEIGISGGGHDEMAGVQFESLEQFFRGVKLFNEEQRLEEMHKPKRRRSPKPKKQPETPAPDGPSNG